MLLVIHLHVSNWLAINQMVVVGVAQRLAIFNTKFKFKSFL